MTEKFLRARHWQLFTLSFGIPFLMQLLGTAVSVSNVAKFDSLEALPAWPYYLSFAGSLAIGAVMYGWTWSVGHGLQQRIAREFRRSTIGFGAVLITLAVLCVSSFAYSGDTLLILDASNTFTLLFWTLLPLLSVWMVAHLYCAAYVADLIITAEEEREPTTHELIQLSLQIWLFPVGIWLVQPRVNRLARRSPQPHGALEAEDVLVFGEQSQPA
ncbi:hypothetical protein [Lewinella sp. IMCC34191]|uniref:hypothetical protein n=1 Tax=Lewinella sp. IMCC34191 TaxID=2259172 RepID=UPI00130087B2|nr:hypothetical protein [Lewinella sp. IMCC34191]